MKSLRSGTMRGAESWKKGLVCAKKHSFLWFHDFFPHYLFLLQKETKEGRFLNREGQATNQSDVDFSNESFFLFSTHSLTKII